jgi:predicted RNA-binding Zn-ribbon protein involved in translation (DUF1610 family)
MPIVATTLMISSAATVAAVGIAIALLAWGIRGRRVDDHPVCVHCGFDLVGKPATTHVCSECGSDLRDSWAIRTGNRVRRPVAIVIALPMLLAFVALLGTFGWMGVRGTNANQHLPTWWLISEINRRPGSVRDGALAELSRRLQLGTLSAEQVKQVANRALAIQADGDQPWTVHWGNFIEGAHDKGALPDELWQKYVRQVLADGLKASTRPVLRRGDDLPTEFTIIEGRHGNTYMFNTSGTITVTVGGAASERLPLQEDARLSMSNVIVTATYQVPFSAEKLKEIADGNQPVHVSVAASVTPSPLTSTGVVMNLSRSSGLPGPLPTAPIDVTLTADAPPITLLAADRSSVTVVADAARRATVAEALSADFYPDTGGLILEIHVQQPPVSLEGDVFLRHGTAERKVGHLFYQAPGIETETFFIGKLDLPCEVVLRPKIETALTTLDVSSIYWGEQIVLKNVPQVPKPGKKG